MKRSMKPFTEHSDTLLTPSKTLDSTLSNSSSNTHCNTFEHRKITGGLHADFYPLLMEALGLGYKKNIMRTFVENCQMIRSQTIIEITKELEHIQGNHSLLLMS